MPRDFSMKSDRRMAARAKEEEVMARKAQGDFPADL